jgi:hypothetical protein
LRTCSSHVSQPNACDRLGEKVARDEPRSGIVALAASRTASCARRLALALAES